VVVDRNLISKIQKHQNVSFNPFFIIAAQRLAGVSRAGLDIIKTRKYARDGVVGEMHSRLHTALRPGYYLDQMVQQVQTTMSEEVVEGDIVNMFEWIRGAVTMASTDAVYGKYNPFRLNRILLNAFQ
jgi:hypothetical protein